MEREIIRTLGLYQPFASLMLHGKIETRWVRRWHKPPFALGKYLIYSTKKEFEDNEVEKLSNTDTLNRIRGLLKNEPTRWLRGFGLCTADLVDVRPLLLADEPRAFVNCVGTMIDIVDHKEVFKSQWALVFDNVTRIIPFPFKGQQGVGKMSLDRYGYLLEPAQNQPLYEQE